MKTQQQETQEEENDFKIKELSLLDLKHMSQSEDIIFKDNRKDLQEFVDFLNEDESWTIYD